MWNKNNTSPKYILKWREQITPQQKLIKGEIIFESRGPLIRAKGKVSSFPIDWKPIENHLQHYTPLQFSGNKIILIGEESYSASYEILAGEMLNILNGAIEDIFYYQGQLIIADTISPPPPPPPPEEEQIEPELEIEENVPLEEQDIEYPIYKTEDDGIKYKYDKNISGEIVKTKVGGMKKSNITKPKLPKGLGGIIILLLKKAIKSSFRAELAIDKIITPLMVSCPSEDKLKEVIKKRNRINNALTQLQQLVGSIVITNKTADKIISLLNTIITVVKAIPIPTAPIPIPINVITIASDVLDTAKSIVEKNKGIVESGGGAFEKINNLLQKLIDKLNSLDLLINKCIEQLPEDKQQEIQTLLNTTSTDSSNPIDDKAKGEALLSQLDPNSNNPLFYRGFRLQIEQNPNNPLETIPQRRVVGIQAKTHILTVATDYSFASTTEVLVNEAKFLIDKWYIEQEPVTSNVDLAMLKILEDEPTIPEIEIEELNLPSPIIDIPPLPEVPSLPVPPTVEKLYYTSRQAQDLGEIANKTGVSIGTLENLNASDLVVGKFYKNERKAKKGKPNKGSQIRYQ